MFPIALLLQIKKGVLHTESTLHRQLNRKPQLRTFMCSEITHTSLSFCKMLRALLVRVAALSSPPFVRQQKRPQALLSDECVRMLRVFWTERLVCGITMALDDDRHGVRSIAHWWRTEGLKLVYDVHRTPDVAVMALFKTHCIRILLRAEDTVMRMSWSRLQKLVHCINTLKRAFKHSRSLHRAHREGSFFSA